MSEHTTTTIRPKEIDSISLRDFNIRIIEWPAKEAEGDRKAQPAKKAISISFYDKRLNRYAQVGVTKATLETLQKEMPNLLKQFEKKEA